MYTQEFLNDQSRTLARVHRYCEATGLSSPIDPYVYSHDASRHFLLCRNHKVTYSTVNSFKNYVELLQVASYTMMNIFRIHLSGLPKEM